LLFSQARISPSSYLIAATRMEDILTLNKYADVFREGLRSLSSDMEIEFTIDFVLGMAPFLKAPYRMVLKELSELKELWDKGFS
jgi:hypothetical protein